MAKKLSLLLAAVAVLAIAIPAMANAAVPLTSGGAKVEIGTAITGTSTNAKTETGIGLLTCKSVVLKGTVTKNEAVAGETLAEGAGSGEFTGSECEVEGTKEPVEKITLTNIKTGTKAGFTTGNGSASFSFQATLPVVGVCKFTGTNVPGTYSTTEMTNKLTITKGSLSASPSACGPARLTGDFFLTKTTGGAKVEIT